MHKQKVAVVWLNSNSNQTLTQNQKNLAITLIPTILTLLTLKGCTGIGFGLGPSLESVVLEHFPVSWLRCVQIWAGIKELLPQIRRRSPAALRLTRCSARLPGVRLVCPGQGGRRQQRCRFGAENVLELFRVEDGQQPVVDREATRDVKVSRPDWSPVQNFGLGVCLEGLVS